MKFSLFLLRLLLTLLVAEAEQCTPDEQQRINALPEGYSVGAFPRTVDECAKKAVGLLAGIRKVPYHECFQQRLNLSSSCSDCFWTASQYAFQNCKMACIKSWCTSKCLECTKPSFAGIATCAGTPGPATVKCDGVPGSQTGAENPMAFLAHKMFGQRLYSVFRMVTETVQTPQGTLVACGVIFVFTVGLLNFRMWNQRDRNVAVIDEENHEPIDEVCNSRTLLTSNGYSDVE
jgi:hypothetical protein